MGDDEFEARLSRVRAVFPDGARSDDLAQAQAETMVGLGSGLEDDGDGMPFGLQVVLLSESGCSGYWHLGPEHTGSTVVGAYASLLPGQAEPGLGVLREAAAALVRHNLLVLAGAPHLTCAGRTHPEDLDLDGPPSCPCDRGPVVGGAVP